MSRPARDVVVIALALAGIALSSLAGCGGTRSAQPTTVHSAPPQESVQAAARRFLDRYVTPDGRVQRLDQGGDTVGEGQAYGMLLAAAIGDAQRFDAIWGWTKANLRRSDGLLSFLWRDGRVQDANAASDADLDASRALLVAACRLHRPALRQDALALGKAIMQGETASFDGGPALVAGPWARKAPVTVNPSYFSPAAFAALQAASGDGRWGSLAASSRAITSALMQAPSRLPPDWASLQGAKPVPIGPPSTPQVPPQFGFDAVRMLVRMAEDPDPAGQRIAARAWPVFEGQDPAKLPVEHDLSGRPTGGTLHPVALVAAAGAAAAAGDTAARDRLLAAAEALDKRMPTYYGAAWVALGRIMLTTKLLDACS
ncbi:MAG: glycosyl hydrolase family 8 [Solirubrobacteraceae bacterium]